MVRPERRTRADIAAAATIVVVVAALATLCWWTSDARATISRPAAAPVAALVPAPDVPAALHQLWSAASPKTSEPVIVGGAVVTGDGHDMVGHDPASGAVLWSYARDLELCGVTWVYHDAVAVYPDRRGCGQLSTVNAETGGRGPTRTGLADKQVTLSSDGTTVLSAGSSRLELLRSDMVRTIGWGRLDAPIKPGIPPPPVCPLVSSAASSSAVSVLEACPGSTGLRLTLLRPAKDDDTPDVKHVALPGVAGNSGARVLAVSDTTTLVYLPSPQPVVSVIDETGATISATLLPGPLSAQATASRAGDRITLWTGSGVMVFDAADIRYRYTVGQAGLDRPLGPATIMAGKLLIPITSGIGVYDPATGTPQRTIPLRRAPIATAVIPAVAGSTVIEQRGDTLVALG